jgi:MipA family protein
MILAGLWDAALWGRRTLAFAGEIGANALYRGLGELVANPGLRAEFGNTRFMRTYFGITPAEASPALAAYMPSGGLYFIGVELGAYRPLNAGWGITMMFPI